jgi:hypothetical protein
VLDLEPDSFPGGAELMVFEPGGLARRGSINLVKGAIVMMFDLDICEQLRKALAQAKTQAPPNRGGGIM